MACVDASGKSARVLIVEDVDVTRDDGSDEGVPGAVDEYDVSQRG